MFILDENIRKYSLCSHNIIRAKLNTSHLICRRDSGKLYISSNDTLYEILKGNAYAIVHVLFVIIK